MGKELEQAYQCKSCLEYFNLANIPNVAFDFQLQQYIWCCPKGHLNNSIVVYKY